MRQAGRRWLAFLVGVACVAGPLQLSSGSAADAPRAGAQHGPVIDPARPMASSGAGAQGSLSSPDRKSRPTPWDRIRRLERRATRLAPRVVRLARSGRQTGRWFGCIGSIGIDRAGSRQGSWGFLYDERDGTGVDRRTALVRHRDTTSRPQWRLLTMSRAKECLSHAVDPNGTGDNARYAKVRWSVENRAGSWRNSPLALRQRARRLARRVDQLNRSLALASDRFARFDRWESCLAWLPVTEAGVREQDLGYLASDPAGTRHLPAIDIDRSEWDDPDYELLALRGRAQPFRGRFCGPGPGEGVDRRVPPGRSAGRHGDPMPPAAMRLARPTVTAILDEVRDDLAELPDDVEDQRKEALEAVYFDQCVFTVGISEFGSPAGGTGYRFRNRTGSTQLRPALSFDIRGFGLPDFDVMAFPGEEPPQIECNEDAGGQETDE